MIILLFLFRSVSGFPDHLFVSAAVSPVEIVQRREGKDLPSLDVGAFLVPDDDVDGSGDTIHKVISSSRKKAKSIDAMHNAFESSGIFILISSIAYDAEEILEVYYIRQQVEQYFDISKGISRLTPLRVHTEQWVLGHLLLCQIAATINLAIQKRMNQYFENREGMFMALRNQKCEVFAERIVTYEGQSDANQFYKKLRIDYPISFKRQKDAWVASDTIPSPPEDQM